MVGIGVKIIFLGEIVLVFVIGYDFILDCLGLFVISGRLFICFSFRYFFGFFSVGFVVCILFGG